MKQAWNYMRFGTTGTCVQNDKNNREIVRTSKHVDTLWFECNCYENGEYIGRLYGKDAIEWLMA